MRSPGFSFDSIAMHSALSYVVAGLELALALAGAVLLWRIGLSPKARTHPPVIRLPPWNAPIAEFLAFLIFVVGGSMIAAIVSSALVKHLPLRGDEVTVFNGAAAQLGLLTGAVVFQIGFPKHEAVVPPPAARAGIFAAGAATFLCALPVLMATAKAWEVFLQLCGLPVEKQDLIGMFLHAKSPWLVTVMIVLAIVIAPTAEELVFRAGLFRYFRTRMPHWVALLAPAIFFATLHVNWKTLQGLSSLAPLTVLAMFFSLAYERTGRIGTPIVAHALFNLNTVVMIFASVGV